MVINKMTPTQRLVTITFPAKVKSKKTRHLLSFLVILKVRLSLSVV